MSRISKLMLFVDESSVTLPTSASPAAEESRPREDSSGAIERLTMTLSIDRHRRRAVAVALPLAAGLVLAACCGGGSSNTGMECVIVPDFPVTVMV